MKVGGFTRLEEQCCSYSVVRLLGTRGGILALEEEPLMKQKRLC